MTSHGIEASVEAVRPVDSEARRLLRQYECNFGGKALPMGREEVVGRTRGRGAVPKDGANDVVRGGGRDSDLGGVDDFRREGELRFRGEGGHWEERRMATLLLEQSLLSSSG